MRYGCSNGSQQCNCSSSTCLCLGSALEKQAPSLPASMERLLSSGSFMNSTPVMLLPSKASSAANTPTFLQMASAVSLLSPVMTMTCTAAQLGRRQGEVQQVDRLRLCTMQMHDPVQSHDCIVKLE